MFFYNSLHSVFIWVLEEGRRVRRDLSVLPSKHLSSCLNFFIVLSKMCAMQTCKNFCQQTIFCFELHYCKVQNTSSDLYKAFLSLSTYDFGFQAGKSFWAFMLVLKFIRRIKYLTCSLFSFRMLCSCGMQFDFQDIEWLDSWLTSMPRFSTLFLHSCYCLNPYKTVSKYFSCVTCIKRLDLFQHGKSFELGFVHVCKLQGHQFQY